MSMKVTMQLIKYAFCGCGQKTAPDSHTHCSRCMPIALGDLALEGGEVFGVLWTRGHGDYGWSVGRDSTITWTSSEAVARKHATEAV